MHTEVSIGSHGRPYLEITDKEALDAAVALPRIFDVTCRPISKEWSAVVDPPSARPLTLADLKNCGALKF